MQIDPVVSLAMAIQSVKGLYALLLGSGVSRAAGIPTGEEVVLDLIRKVAVLAREDCEPNPRAWYASKFGAEVSYSSLIESLAHTPTERSQLLKSYFEPTSAELSAGRKVPTATHRAVAQLVAKGYVRVIVTTNFDRLLEKAIIDVGIEPTVVSTPDAAQGSLPLPHNQCVIFKVSGDYLDTRIKNSPAELAQYDPRINGILDRVFDEYGLLICGWSGEYDLALRAALERCNTHRFSTYWTFRGEPTETAKALVALRRAEKIAINDADSFFGNLVEKIEALEDLSQPHPLSSKMAVATLKRYLSGDRQEIALHDMIVRETEHAFAQLSEENFPIHPGMIATPPELIRSRLDKYEAVTETLRGLFAAGAYWGSSAYDHVWLKCFERFTEIPVRSGLDVLLNLRLYPALLILYSAGISSTARGTYHTIGAILTKTTFTRPGGIDKIPIASGINLHRVMNPSHAQAIWGTSSNTAMSDYLQATFRDLFREYLPRDADFLYQFDKFEYLMALVCADSVSPNQSQGWGPLGGFALRNRNLGVDVEAEVKKAGDQGDLLTALFQGSMPRFLKARSAIDTQAEAARSKWTFWG